MYVTYVNIIYLKIFSNNFFKYDGQFLIVKRKIKLPLSVHLLCARNYRYIILNFRTIF